MTRRATKPRTDARDIAAEIIRRANGPDGCPPYVIRLSESPTLSERLQLVAARLQRTPVVIMPPSVIQMTVVALAEHASGADVETGTMVPAALRNDPPLTRTLVLAVGVSFVVTPNMPRAD